jgi:hypothetical protein
MTRQIFQPVSEFNFDVNRSERSHQVRWLAPLLAQPDGRAWFLDRLACPCSPEEAQKASVFHLCFPLRDVFTADYYQCRGDTDLEDQFIAYYNCLFDLPEGFGVQEVWHTAPNDEIRHPAAGGRAGWHEDFLEERISDDVLRSCARDVRRMLRTEADVLLLTDSYVILVECKYEGTPSTEQYERHQMMGQTLARRLEKAFYFGMVVEGRRDPRFAQIEAPYVRWAELKERLAEMKGQSDESI